MIKDKQHHDHAKACGPKALRLGIVEVLQLVHVLTPDGQLPDDEGSDPDKSL